MTLPRIFASSKFQAALGASIASAVPLIFTLTDPGLSRTQKQASTETYIKWVMGVFGVAIGATGLEDAAQKYNPVGGNASQSPATVQVNTGPQALNTQEATPPKDPPPAGPSPVIIPQTPQGGAPAVANQTFTANPGTTTFHPTVFPKQ